LVDLCNAAEDVFNALRNGRRGVDAELMDAVMAALDNVNRMMSAIARHQAPSAAPASLIAALQALAGGGRSVARTSAAAAPAAEPPTGDTITEDEFEALLDQLAAERKPGQTNATPAVPDPPAPVTQAATETSVRVDTQKLDRMMNLVGELVLVRNRLKALHGTSADAFGRAIGQLDLITRSLQGAVMQTRMQPIGKVFSRFPKVARDTARALGKQVEVSLLGQETDLDKNLVEALADPLVHMVRNAVDHGIEMPETRVQAGKPATGRLELSAQQAGDHILITVRDDGAGIDAEKLRAKAQQRGLIDAESAARMSAEEALQLVFLPGLSTKEQVSDLSGRGVGMDVVKTSIQQLNGSVHIESRPGAGTLVRIRVPLTLAVLPALMVMVGKRQFALPLAAIDDVFALDPSRVRPLNRWRVLPLKKETLRLVYLQHWLGLEAVDSNPHHVVVARVNDERYGFVVSLVRGREEVVIKPLGPKLHGLAGVAGATVTPEGRVALILDFAGLLSAYARTMR
jgi:two-component system, chemotaxis family, sensor kinase CheA